MNPNITASLEAVRRRIAESEREYARHPGAVQLLAVSKTQPAARIRDAYHAGQHAFGENYLQEALDKMQALDDLPLQWHFIGPIQSNKTGPLAARFDWVHTIDREKIARRLAAQRPPERGPLNVLIQVNLDGEASKSGVDPAALPALAAVVASLPTLALRGLMAIPAPVADSAAQRATFRQLALARDALVQAGYHDCRELSMGMSGDMEAAIAEGATFVRIGTDIFGQRDHTPS